jgi:hypothetical protein
LDILPQPGIHEFARSPRLTGPGSRQCLRRAGPIRSSPRVVLRADSRLTVLGARPNTLAIVRNEWPHASPRLKVSRSSALMCL